MRQEAEFDGPRLRSKRRLRIDHEHLLKLKAEAFFGVNIIGAKHDRLFIL